MSTQLTVSNKQSVAVQNCKNVSLTEQYIHQFQYSSRTAIEHILSMGEAVLGVYKKSKSGELNDSDLDYFCQSVGLDHKSPMFRKYKQIGENASEFRKHINKMPSAFSTVYELTTLDSDTFYAVLSHTQFSNSSTLEQIKKMAQKSTRVLAKNTSFHKPRRLVNPTSLAKTLREVNRFSIVISTDLQESHFDSIVQVLTDYRNKGWIKFDDPQILDRMNDFEDEEQADMDKYFAKFREQDIVDMAV
jgi:regulator of sigma D